jgi:catechol 2,3-dioxygenase-like lactoylglutathione lyase family enzyme
MTRGLHLNSRRLLRSSALLVAAALAPNCSKDTGDSAGRRGQVATGGAPFAGGSAGTSVAPSSGAPGKISNSGAMAGAPSAGGSNNGAAPESSGGHAGTSAGAAASGAPANGGTSPVTNGGTSSAGAPTATAGSSGAGGGGGTGNDAAGASGNNTMAAAGIAGVAGAAPVTFPSNLPADDGIGHFHHVHLNVVDPTATMTFFTTWFTGEVTTLPGGHSALWTQASWILFDQVATPAPSAIVSSIYHIGWTVADVQKSYDAMVAGGVPFDTPLSDISTVFGGTGGTKFAYATGPDHELVEFYNGSDDHFRHVHFVSDDPVSAGQWYQKHFGAVSMQANPSRATGSVNGRQIKPNMSVTIDAITVWWYPTGFVQATYPNDWAGLTDLVPQRGRVIDHIALGVNNLPAALTRLQAEGVQILEAPAWRMDGAFISAFVQGPDSVEVEVVQGQAMHP